jgi:hypothetical protein
MPPVVTAEWLLRRMHLFRISYHLCTALAWGRRETGGCARGREGLGASAWREPIPVAHSDSGPHCVRSCKLKLKVSDSESKLCLAPYTSWYHGGTCAWRPRKMPAGLWQWETTDMHVPVPGTGLSSLVTPAPGPVLSNATQLTYLGVNVKLGLA